MPNDNNGNKNNNGNRRPRRTAWQQYTFDCGRPMSIVRWLFLTTVVTLLLKVVVLPLLDAEGPSYFSTWLIMAVVIFITDVVVRFTCKSKAWYSDHPYSEWSYRPQTFSGYFSWFMVVVLVLLLGWYYLPSSENGTSWDIKSLIPSLSILGFGQDGSDSVEDRTANTSIAQRLDKIDQRITENYNNLNLLWAKVTDSNSTLPIEVENSSSLSEGSSSESENSELQNNGSGSPTTSVSALDVACHNSGYVTEECASTAGFSAYWDQVRDDPPMKDKVSYTFRSLTKCWDCGNLFSGTGRYPETCNPFISTMNGRHPLTGVSTVSKRSCLEPPSSL